ncbi:MAG: preprotein translocase subunit SecA [Firmicutes bacterium]|nr:preprotein translocase subunit SecA [Bacillota bacterium]
MGIVSWLQGSDNRKNIKKFTALAEKIELLEPKYQTMDDETLKAQTDVLKARLAKGETLDDILEDAFATVREAAKRVLGMRAYKVQLMGGACLHQGRIAEMRTGEGKTLVATLPTYLNALSGEGVHVVTVNDYLAKRDAEWMGKVHRFLGLTVGVAIAGMNNDEKRKAYLCDITYATNNELGFDYLRDNMVIYAQDLVQRPLSYAIIDEVDSILIDEARTPLIISGAGRKSDEDYVTANRFAKTLIAPSFDEDGEISDEGDFEIDEKKKTIHLTDTGVTKAERFFGLDDITAVENAEKNHYINNAIRANFIMKRDKDYVVQDGEILIVDEFTGRLMIGRRYSEGLHQAIEAKENVKIQNENKTMATITFQNYFRLYKKLAGMTGTAKTEEQEFRGIYGLDVVTIPTNLPSQRVDENDRIFKTVNGKYMCMIEDIKECYERGQPVLVGTTSVEKSEELSDMLKKERVPHRVLNAKHHEKEAEIVAQAGKLNAVTIATNMAGRGTDIMLGGNAEYLALTRMRQDGVSEEHIYHATSFFNTEDPEILNARKIFKKYYDEYKIVTDAEKKQVIEVGGLRIIGTERHESRRIDNQLRGRAGRQGDMGSSAFYISAEDDLTRVFGEDRMKRIISLVRAPEDVPIENGMLSKIIEGAQRRIEGNHFSTRKVVLEYDNVMNAQRTTIYQERSAILQGKSVHEQILGMMEVVIEHTVDLYTDEKTDYPEWDIEGLNKEIYRILLPTEPEFLTEERLRRWDREQIKDELFKAMQILYKQKIDVAKTLEPPVDFEEVERVILLKIVDSKWMDHIDMMDSLRKGIGLKAYGQQDPVTAYKQEGSEMFYDMNTRIQEETISLLMRVHIERAPIKREGQTEGQLIMSRGDGKPQKVAKTASVNLNRSIGRNDNCPCGSNKKYKMCCWEKDRAS